MNMKNGFDKEIDFPPMDYELLANAIIKNAAQDYAKAIREIRNRTDNFQTHRIKKECVEFFLSDCFKQLTDVDGDYILNRLNAELEKEMEEKIQKLIKKVKKCIEKNKDSDKMADIVTLKKGMHLEIVFKRWKDITEGSDDNGIVEVQLYIHKYGSLIDGVTCSGYGKDKEDYIDKDIYYLLKMYI